MRIRNLIHRTLALLLLSAALLSLNACNTVKGAGKDIEKGGEKLQDASDGAK